MVDAHDYGAVGDGNADDTEALAHALQSGDGILRLRKGTYRITQPLVVDLTRTGYASVGGQGGASRIVMTGAGPAIRIVGNHRGTALPRTVKPPTWERERFPTIEGIEIVGKHPQAVGIELRKTMQATLSRILVRNCRYGIHLVERNRNFVLSDSHLYDNAEYGLFFDRCNLHQTIVHGNHISYNKRAGIKSLDGDVHNLQITGNDIEYNNDPGSRQPVGEKPTGAEIWFEADKGIISEVTIASNTIQATVQPGGANIRIHGPLEASPTGARLIAITGNVIGSQQRGIELEHAHRVAITGNTIYDSAELSLAAAHCSAIAVGANTVAWRNLDADRPRDGFLFEDCDNCALTGLVTHKLGYGDQKQGGAITLLRCTDMAVTGCQLTDPRVRGIDLVDCSRCRISDNSIVDRRARPMMRNAIRLTGRGSNNLVQHNLVGGSTERHLDVPNGQALLTGNVEINH